MSEVLKESPSREIPRDRLWSVEEVSYFLGVPVGTLYSCEFNGAARRATG